MRTVRPIYRNFRRGIALSATAVMISGCLGGSKGVDNLFSGDGSLSLDNIFGQTALELSPPSRTYPTTNVGGTVSATFTITNVSNKTIVLDTHSGQGSHFSVDPTSSCFSSPNLNLAAQQSCQMTASFSPQSAGSHEVSLAIGYRFLVDPGKTLSASIKLNGVAINALNFTGLQSVDSITTTRATLHWTHDPDATTYYVYRQTGTAWNLVAPIIAPASTYVMAGLSPATSYRVRVFAVDQAGNLVSNTSSINFTTDPIGTFAAVGTMSGAEGTSFNSGPLSCSDSLSSAETYQVESTTPDLSCTISGTPSTLGCTAAHRTGQSNWTGTVRIRCEMNDWSYFQDVTINVSNVNRPPTLTTIANSRVNTGTTLLVDAQDGTNDSDIDLDDVSYTCTVSGGVITGTQNCSTLAGASFSASTGILEWVPTVVYLVSGTSTDYSFSITGGDSQSPPLTDTRFFTVTVDPAVTLTTVSDASVPVGEHIPEVDIDNVASADDSGMSYSCVYDSVVDNAVTGGTNCSSLPGVISFNPSTGVLNWTPNTLGTFELLITGSNGGLTDTEVFVRRVVPKNNSITPPISATYAAASNVDFILNFSHPVTVSGTPRLEVTVGGQTRFANYSSGTGSSGLTFRYIPTPGDLDLDGIGLIGALDFNSGWIRDINANNVLTTLPSVNLSGVNIDAVAPTVSSVIPPADGTYLGNQNMDFSIVFSEVVNVTGTPRIALTVGATTVHANYHSGSGGTTLLFRYQPATNATDSDGIALASTNLDLNAGTIRDMANQNSSLSLPALSMTGVRVDAKRPLISSISPATGTFGPGQNLDVTITFDEAVIVNGTPRLELAVGLATRYANYTLGSGTPNLTFRYQVQAGDLDPDGITILNDIQANGGSIRDAATNDAHLGFVGLTYATSAVDAQAPQVIGVTLPTNGNYRNNQNLDFIVTLSESVTVLGSPRLNLTIGATPRPAVFLSNSGSALTFRYTVQSSDLDADGIVANTSITLNGATIRDAVGNDASLTIGSQDLTGVFVDGSSPTIVSVLPPTAAIYTTSHNIDFVLNFSESVTVTGSPRIALDVGGVTRYANYLSGTTTSALVFRYTVALLDNDANGISIPSASIDLNGGTVRDASGNDSVLTFAPPALSSVRVDALAPTVTLVTAPAAKTFIGTEHIDFTLTFSEVVTVSGAPRIALTVGSATRYAQFLSGSTTNQLVFRYSLNRGDYDTNGIQLTTSMIDLNGGNIVDGANLTSELSFTAPATSGLLVESMLLTSVVDRTQANGSALTALTAMSAIDINNDTTGGDAGMTYNCAFDSSVDGSVVGSPCSNLPGTATFSPTTGILTWTPAPAVGFYELRVTGTKGSDSFSRIFVLEVRDGYETSHLLASYQARWLSSAGAGRNSPFDSIWRNIATTGSSYDASLSNFGQTPSSGWAGDGTTTNPFRLVLDGVNDLLDLGTVYNSVSTLTVEGWVRPSSPSTANRVIWGNRDASGNGFLLRQAATGGGNLELVTGPTYEDEVLADSPKLYLKFEETSGPTFSDSSGNGNHATITGTVTFNQSGGPTGTRATQFNGTSYATCGTTGFRTNPPVTLEAWAYFANSQGAGDFDYVVQSSDFSNSELFAIKREASTNRLYFVKSGTIYSGPVIPTAQWTHIVVAYRATAPFVRVYVNGVDETASITQPPSAINPNGPVSCQIARFSGNTHFLSNNSRIDEVAVYDYELSAARALSHYQAGICRSTSVLSSSSWIHLATRFTSTFGELYINGTKECEAPRGAGFNASLQNLSLGATASGSNAWGGSIGELRTYSSASPAVISNNRLNTRARYGVQPSGISDLVIWLDANDLGLADGDPVPSWTDKSATGRVFSQGDTSRRPTYRTNVINAQPVVRFDGSNDTLLSTALQLGNNYSTFAVVRPLVNTGNWTNIFENGSGARVMLWLNNNPYSLQAVGHREGSFTNSSVAVSPLSSPSLVGYVITSGELQLYINGASATTNNPTQGSTPALSGAFGVGGRSDGYTLNGDIAEIVIYNKSLSSTEVQQLKDYFNDKYGFGFP